MRAPTNRRSAGPIPRPDDATDTVDTVTADDLINTSDFRTRMVEARAKRRRALARRQAECDALLRAPKLSPETVVEPEPVAAELPSWVVTDEVAPMSTGYEAAAPSVEDADEEAHSPAVFAHIPHQIELSDDAAARQRLGAAMTLSSMPNQPLEPALVPMVSAATLAGLRMRHVVPATLGLVAVAFAAWITGRSADETAAVEPMSGATVETATVAPSVSQPVEERVTVTTSDTASSDAASDPVNATRDTEVAALDAPRLGTPARTINVALPIETPLRAYSMYDTAPDQPVAVALRMTPNLDERPIPGAAISIDAAKVAPELAANGTERSLRPVVRPRSAVNVSAAGSSVPISSEQIAVRSAEPLPQVVDETSVAIATSVAQSAWRPASRLAVEDTSFGLPTRNTAAASADPLIARLQEEPRGIRKFFKGLGTPKPMTAERFKAENAD